VASQTKRADDAEDRLNATRQAAQEAAQSHANHRRMFDALTTEHETTTKRLSSALEEITQLTSTLNTTREQLRELREDKARQASERETWSAQRAQSQKEVERATAGRLVAEEEATRATNQLTKLRMVETELSSVREQVTRQDSRESTMQREMLVVRNDNSQLKERVRQLEEEVTGAQAKLNSEQVKTRAAEMAEAREKLVRQAAEARATELMSQLSTRAAAPPPDTNVPAELPRLLQHANKALVEAQQRLVLQKQSNATLSAELHEVKASLAGRTETLMELERRAKSSDEAVGDLVATLIARESQLNELKGDGADTLV